MCRPHFSRLRLLSHCPWCIFHVRWKDKHSCNLMTLECFWDSEYVCTRVHACRADSFAWGRVHFSEYLLKLLMTTTPPHHARLCAFWEVPSGSHACHSMVRRHPECCALYTPYFTSGLRSPVCKNMRRRNTQHTQINACTLTVRRPPRRDEANCELQMKLKTEALLSDKWDKYAHGLSPLLTFTRCTSLTPHKWSRRLSPGINLPIYYLISEFSPHLTFKKTFFLYLCVDVF